MNRRTFLAISIMLISGILCLAIANLFFNLKTVAQNQTIVTSEPENLRFQKVETFVFERIYDKPTTAVIYEDTKTGIKYLYIWKGGANGSPCITGIWDS